MKKNADVKSMSNRARRKTAFSANTREQSSRYEDSAVKTRKEPKKIEEARKTVEFIIRKLRYNTSKIPIVKKNIRHGGETASQNYRAIEKLAWQPVAVI